MSEMFMCGYAFSHILGKRERWKDKASLCQEGTARWLRLMAREVRKRGQEAGREEEAGGPERESKGNPNIPPPDG